MVNFNFHQHSLFSDGKESCDLFIKKGIELGFCCMGFSEHSPLPFNTYFSMKQEKVKDYVNEINILKGKYKGKINIFISMELDYVPQSSENFSYWNELCKLDYTIGAVHLIKADNSDELWFIDGPDRNVYDKGLMQLFDNNAKKAVKTYFYQINNMLESQDIDIIAHLDKIKMHNENRFFTEDEKWYRQLVNETISLIKEKDVIVEINTRGIYKNKTNKLFPDDYTLKKVIEKNIPVVISSDAHKSEELNLHFDQTLKKIKQLGVKSIMFFNNNGWHEKSII
jgi:histidinol-phosphatase (PHP family)